MGGLEMAFKLGKHGEDNVGKCWEREGRMGERVGKTIRARKDEK